MSLNQQMAQRLAACSNSDTPLLDTIDLVAQMDEHDGECWYLYLSKGDYLPAGGYWWNYQEWRAGRKDGSPQEVADLLDNPD